jgi:hypothetical protein
LRHGETSILGVEAGWVKQYGNSETPETRGFCSIFRVGVEAG